MAKEIAEPIANPNPVFYFPTCGSTVPILGSDSRESLGVSTLVKKKIVIFPMQITFNANTPIHIFHGIEVQESNGIQTKKNEPDRTICEKNDICADVSKHQNNHVNIE